MGIGDILDYLSKVDDLLREIKPLTAAIRDSQIQTNTLLTLLQKQAQEEAYFDIIFPPDGGTFQIPIGDTMFDFDGGEVTLPDGTTIPMSTSLKMHGVDFAKSIYVESDKDISFKITDTSTVKTVTGGDYEALNFVNIKHVVITATFPSYIKIAISSDPRGVPPKVILAMLNRPITMDALSVVATYGGGLYPGDVLAAGGANSTISFDLPDFSNIARLIQVVITQRIAGLADFTLEIWETATYNPAVRADLIKRLWTRDYIVDENSSVFDPITLYLDRDNASKLHLRIVNNIGGQASEFDVSLKALIDRK